MFDEVFAEDEFTASQKLCNAVKFRFKLQKLLLVVLHGFFTQCNAVEFCNAVKF